MYNKVWLHPSNIFWTKMSTLFFVILYSRNFYCWIKQSNTYIFVYELFFSETGLFIVLACVIYWSHYLTKRLLVRRRLYILLIFYNISAMMFASIVTSILNLIKELETSRNTGTIFGGILMWQSVNHKSQIYIITYSHSNCILLILVGKCHFDYCILIRKWKTYIVRKTNC